MQEDEDYLEEEFFACIKLLKNESKSAAAATGGASLFQRQKLVNKKQTKLCCNLWRLWTEEGFETAILHHPNS